MKKHSFLRTWGIVLAATLMTSLAEASDPPYSGTVDWKKVERNCLWSLSSPNPGVRQCVINQIAEYRLREAVGPLITILQKDSVESVRKAAALTLIVLGDERGRNAVEEASLYDGSDKVARFCAELLNAYTKYRASL